MDDGMKGYDFAYGHTGHNGMQPPPQQGLPSLQFGMMEQQQPSTSSMGYISMTPGMEQQPNRPLMQPTPSGMNHGHVVPSPIPHQQAPHMQHLNGQFMSVSSQEQIRGMAAAAASIVGLQPPSQTSTSSVKLDGLPQGVVPAGGIRKPKSNKVKMEEPSMDRRPDVTDTAGNIIGFLMLYNLDSDDEFSRKALESLHKKIKDRPQELETLIGAVASRGAEVGGCITVQKTLDGRLQVAGRKGFPHVIYAKIFRWPDLHKNELKHNSVCKYAFDSKHEALQVCVNPYHYDRVTAPSISVCDLGIKMNNGQEATRSAHHKTTIDMVANPSYNAAGSSSLVDSNGVSALTVGEDKEKTEPSREGMEDTGGGMDTATPTQTTPNEVPFASPPMSTTPHLAHPQALEQAMHTMGGVRRAAMQNMAQQVAVQPTAVVRIEQGQHLNGQALPQAGAVTNVVSSAQYHQWSQHPSVPHHPPHISQHAPSNVPLPPPAQHGQTTHYYVNQQFQGNFPPPQFASQPQYLQQPQFYPNQVHQQQQAHPVAPHPQAHHQQSSGPQQSQTTPARRETQRDDCLQTSSSSQTLPVIQGLAKHNFPDQRQLALQQEQQQRLPVQPRDFEGQKGDGQRARRHRQQYGSVTIPTTHPPHHYAAYSRPTPQSQQAPQLVRQLDKKDDPYGFRGMKGQFVENDYTGRINMQAFSHHGASKGRVQAEFRGYGVQNFPPPGSSTNPIPIHMQTSAVFPEPQNLEELHRISAYRDQERGVFSQYTEILGQQVQAAEAAPVQNNAENAKKESEKNLLAMAPGQGMEDDVNINAPATKRNTSNPDKRDEVSFHINIKKEINDEVPLSIISESVNDALEVIKEQAARESKCYKCQQHLHGNSTCMGCKAEEEASQAGPSRLGTAVGAIQGYLKDSMMYQTSFEKPPRDPAKPTLLPIISPDLSSEDEGKSKKKNKKEKEGEKKEEDEEKPMEDDSKDKPSSSQQNMDDGIIYPKITPDSERVPHNYPVATSQPDPSAELRFAEMPPPPFPLPPGMDIETYNKLTPGPGILVDPMDRGPLHDTCGPNVAVRDDTDETVDEIYPYGLNPARIAAGLPPVGSKPSEYKKKPLITLPETTEGSDSDPCEVTADDILKGRAVIQVPQLPRGRNCFCDYKEGEEPPCRIGHHKHYPPGASKEMIQAAFVLSKYAIRDANKQGKGALYEWASQFTCPAVSMRRIADDEPPPVAPQPLNYNWCAVNYYEFRHQVGQLRQVHLEEFFVDGGLDVNHPQRYCVGVFPNPLRSYATEHIRMRVGSGIRISVKENGDMWLRCMSRFPVFVSSVYLDAASGRVGGDAIHKIYPGGSLKVFDLEQCKLQIDMLFNYQKKAFRVHSNRAKRATLPAPLNTFNRREIRRISRISTDDMQRMCLIKISFIKGWGPGYRRKSILECPAWVEVIINRATDYIDSLLVRDEPIYVMSDHDSEFYDDLPA